MMSGFKLMFARLGVEGKSKCMLWKYLRERERAEKKVAS